MKIFRYVFVLCLMLMSNIAVVAQNSDMETLTWARHGIEFDVPKGVQVTENGKDSFSAEFDDFVVRFTLFDPKGGGVDTFELMLNELSSKMGITVIDSGDLDQNNLIGNWVEGPMTTGAMMLMGLVANESGNVAVLCEIIYYPNLGDYADKVLDSLRFVQNKK